MNESLWIEHEERGEKLVITIESNKVALRSLPNMHANNLTLSIYTTIIRIHSLIFNVKAFQNVLHVV